MSCRGRVKGSSSGEDRCSSVWYQVEWYGRLSGI